MAAKTDKAPAIAPPIPVVKISAGSKAALPAAAIMPRTEKRPSIDPNTSSADLLLPALSSRNSLLWMASLGQLRRGMPPEALPPRMSMLLLDEGHAENLGGNLAFSLSRSRSRIEGLYLIDDWEWFRLRG